MALPGSVQVVYVDGIFSIGNTDWSDIASLARLHDGFILLNLISAAFVISVDQCFLLDAA